jgi:hypothetical protein
MKVTVIPGKGFKTLFSNSNKVFLGLENYNKENMLGCKWPVWPEDWEMSNFCKMCQIPTSKQNLKAQNIYIKPLLQP